MDAGLEGIVAAETCLSDVRGEEGRLIVRGLDLEDLVARCGFEATAALLWSGFAEPEMDAAAVKRTLAEARVATGKLIPHFVEVADGLQSVEALRLGLSMLPEETAVPAHLRARTRRSVKPSGCLPSMVPRYPGSSRLVQRSLAFALQSS